MLSLILSLMLPACELEYGSTQAACYWDASESGNLTGSDVVNLSHGELWFTLDNPPTT